MKKKFFTLLTTSLLLASCTENAQFTGWQTEEFGETRVTESTTRTFILANPSDEGEQHVRAIAFDRGSNSPGHYRIDSIKVGEREVAPTDIVIPPGSNLAVQVTYAPVSLEVVEASYGGWVTGEPRRWIPKNPDEAAEYQSAKVIQRAIIEAVYDYPREGFFFVQLVGEALAGPRGEEESGGANATCRPGNGTACYTGGFSLDIPDLAPGGPKPLEMTGPIKFNISGGAASMRMDDFPFVLYVLRSSEIPQLPSGVTATLVLSGGQGAEATGTFDGSRLSLHEVTFRIRVTLGELTVDQVKNGMSSLVDFELSDIDITTTSPYDQGEITLHLETTIPQNPSGNELFDQFLSGARVMAVMEGELAF